MAAFLNRLATSCVLLVSIVGLSGARSGTAVLMFLGMGAIGLYALMSDGS